MQNRSGLNGVVRCSGRLGTVLAVVLAAVIGTSVSRGTAFAQSLNWEGQTGVFVTPLAYSVSTGSTSLSLPVVSYHYLNAGPVLGGFHQVSVTMGAFNRIEFGYTRSLHQDGTTAGLSELWSGGFNAFHGKVNLFRERRAGLPLCLWASWLGLRFEMSAACYRVRIRVIRIFTLWPPKRSPTFVNFRWFSIWASKLPMLPCSGWRETLPAIPAERSARAGLRLKGRDEARFCWVPKSYRSREAFKACPAR